MFFCPKGWVKMDSSFPGAQWHLHHLELSGWSKDWDRVAGLFVILLQLVKWWDGWRDLDWKSSFFSICPWKPGISVFCNFFVFCLESCCQWVQVIACAQILSVVTSYYNIYIHFNKTIFLCVMHRSEKHSSCHMVLNVAEELGANVMTFYCVKVIVTVG